MEFAFRRRYNLPPTDPRFLDATREEIAADFWAHHYAESNVTEEFEDTEFDADEITAQWAKEDAAAGRAVDPDDDGFETVIDTTKGIS